MDLRSTVPLCALVLAATLPGLAAANPITAGVHVGVTQTKEDGAAGMDANDTLGLFGRLGFNKRIAGQLEVQRIKTADGSGVDIRTATASLVIDLTQGKSHFVPTIAAGLGIDSASPQYGSSTDGHHFEGGFGLEYRADGGLTIGAELRLGGRSIDDEDKAVPVLDGDVAYYAPQTLREGEYRSARLFLGVRF